jgi:hypothetical protein
MSLILATQLTAIATVALAAFAIVTAVFAFLAFRKQAQEVRAIERQVHDQEELTRQQAELLKVQAGQLDLQLQQFGEQCQANARQAGILELQGAELRESLADRKREAAARHRAQASCVLIAEMRHPYISDPAVITGGTAYIEARISNDSGEAIYDAELRWHQGSAPYGEPNPEPLRMLIPHDGVYGRRVFPRDTNLDVCGAVLTFRDAAGVRWMRKSDGELTEQPEP